MQWRVRDFVLLTTMAITGGSMAGCASDSEDSCPSDPNATCPAQSPSYLDPGPCPKPGLYCDYRSPWDCPDGGTGSQVGLVADCEDDCTWMVMEHYPGTCN